MVTKKVVQVLSMAANIIESSKKERLFVFQITVSCHQLYVLPNTRYLSHCCNGIFLNIRCNGGGVNDPQVYSGLCAT